MSDNASGCDCERRVGQNASVGALVLAVLLALTAAHCRPALSRPHAPTDKVSEPSPVHGAPNTNRRSKAPSTLHEGMQLVMGTRLQIAFEAPPGIDGPALLAELFTRVRADDALLSNYQPTSPLSQLNRRAWSGPLPARLREFLRLGLRLCAATEGAFSLGIGRWTSPVRAGRKQNRAAHPDGARGSPEPCACFSLVGDEARLRPRVVLDPGGLGKGFALDALVARLRRAGVREALLNFGGSSFYSLGRRRAIGVQSASSEQLAGWVWLKDQGLSSSKSYADGRSHIVDPLRGRLIAERRTAVVIASSAGLAEGLSTALVAHPELIAGLERRYPGARLWLQRANHRPQGNLIVRKRRAER